MHWCSKRPVLVHATLTAKNAHALVYARLCNGAATTLPLKLLQTILSLVQASCRLLFAIRPHVVLTKSVVQRFSLKKTDQIHASSWHSHCCIVAQASSNHPRWCGPHPAHPWLAPAVGGRTLSWKDSIFDNLLAGVLLDQLSDQRRSNVTPKPTNWEMEKGQYSATHRKWLHQRRRTQPIGSDTDQHGRAGKPNCDAAQPSCFAAWHYWVRSICSTQHCPRALLACNRYLLAATSCHCLLHLLLPLALRKPGPRSIGFGSYPRVWAIRL